MADVYKLYGLEPTAVASEVVVLSSQEICSSQEERANPNATRLSTSTTNCWRLCECCPAEPSSEAQVRTNPQSYETPRIHGPYKCEHASTRLTPATATRDPTPVTMPVTSRTYETPRVLGPYKCEHAKYKADF